MSDMQQSLVVEFYRQQHQALINYLQSKLGSTQEAYDVAQETYERLLNNDKTAAINNPKAFVFRVASNLAIDRIRQRKMRGDDEVGDFDAAGLVSPILPPDEQIENELTVAMVRMFISELPPKCRSAFLYYKFEEREYGEIANLLGVSESMIRKYVLRAMVYCRERLDQCNQNKDEGVWRAGFRTGDKL
jgi:RNA polymerase sigma factor (sigma-70 family)